MRVIVVVNRVKEIGFRQTTALLAAGLANRGCEVFLADVDGLVANCGNREPAYEVDAVPVPPDLKSDSNLIESIAHHSNQPVPLRLAPGDLILIRTNPGRDLSRIRAQGTFLDICRSARQHGIRVLNDPAHLNYFASKASLAVVDPAHRPPMIISQRHQPILAFVENANCECVIKPLVGSRGRDVIRVSRATAKLGELLAATYGKKGLVAQHFVSSDDPGDKRVVVVDGEILESGGVWGGIERRPAAGDFRGNLHAGGSARPLELTDSQRQAAKYAAELLNAHGIWLAGVDLVGDKIIEFNVFSTGGLFDAIQFSGIDFAGLVIDRLLEKIATDELR